MLGYGRRGAAISEVFRNVRPHPSCRQSPHAAFPGICHTCVDLACMATHRPARSAIAPPVTAIGLARPRRPLALRQTLLERVRPSRGAPGTIAGPGSDALSDTEALRARTVRRTRQ